MLSIDRHGAETIPGLNLQSVSGWCRSSPAPAGLSGSAIPPATATAACASRTSASSTRSSDVNQLVPFQVQMGVESTSPPAHTGVPQEVNMSRDNRPVERPNGLTEDERRVSSAIWAFSSRPIHSRRTTSFSAPIATSHAGMPQYLLRQAFEEASIPTRTQYIVESLRLDEGEVSTPTTRSRVSGTRTSTSSLHRYTDDPDLPDRHARGRTKSCCAAHRVSHA